MIRFTMPINFPVHFNNIVVRRLAVNILFTCLAEDRLASWNVTQRQSPARTVSELLTLPRISGRRLEEIEEIIVSLNE